MVENINWDYPQKEKDRFIRKIKKCFKQAEKWKKQNN